MKEKQIKYKTEDFIITATITVGKKDIYRFLRKANLWFYLKCKYKQWKFNREARKNPEMAKAVIKVLKDFDRFLAYGDDKK